MLPRGEEGVRRTIANGDGWVLVDFVGGPMDGAASRLQATKLAGMVRRVDTYSLSYRRYRLTDPPNLNDDAFE